MQKKWKILDPAPKSFLEEFPELPVTVANLLYHRDIKKQEQIDEFLNPDYSEDVHDPFLFNDMKKTIDRLFEAMEKKEKIIIHGDYDADGVSGCVILTSLFKALDYHNFNIFLPHRENDGYGLNLKSIQTFIEEKADVLISCDCGISNFDEVEMANKNNINVIITDHHTIPEKIPNAFSIIHPKLPGEKYPDKGLAGGAVAFKLAQGMLKKHAQTNENLPNGDPHEGFEKWLLDMVAISTVADMVPLLGESRTLTKYGLIVLNKTKRIGMQKLLLEARLMDEEGGMKKELDADTIGFRIAPQINAAGRLNHANVAYKLLTTDDPIEATDLAFELNKENEDRKKMTENYVKTAATQVKRKQKDSPILFIFDSEWSPGLVGLVASRIKDRFGKPTIAMTTSGDEIMGSGRSVKGFNAIEAITEIEECFSKFGGHPMAFGFTLKSEEVMEEFKQKLINKYKEKTSGQDMTPTLNIDAQVELEDIHWELYDVLEKFKPFGQANPKPKYLARSLTITSLQPVGQEGKHLRIMVTHKTNVVRKTIGWRLCGSENEVNWCEELNVGDMIDMVFEVDINEWNGNRELQLTIVDLKKA